MIEVPKTHGRIRKYLDDRQEIISRHRTLQAARIRQVREQKQREQQYHSRRQHVQVSKDTSPSAYKYAVQTKGKR